MRRFLVSLALVPLGLSAPASPATAAAAADPPRYETYYSIFTRGQQRIPYLDTTPYVPQGLAYWPERDELIVSYYHEDGGSARLAIVDRTTSARTKSLFLDDAGHVQALAMSDRHLWVASDTAGVERVLRYTKTSLAAASEGGTLTRDAEYALLANAFIEITGNRMYVGTYETGGDGTAYRYVLDENDIPRYDHHSFGVPSKVQGMAITPTHFVWSRSQGRNNDSQLTVDPREGPATRTVTAPNMSEDLATVGGELHVVYESAARKYSDADYKVRTIHRGSLSELIP